jgi:GNAT superfamily N-acetyltransferase
LKQETPEYSLKVATEEDFADVKRICLEFFAASIYNEHGIEEDKVDDLIFEYIRNPTERVAILAVLEGNTPCGLVAGTKSTILFNHATVASEVVWWVDKEHRRSGVGLQLLGALEYWALHIAKADYVQMVSLVDDKSDYLDTTYKRFGYQPVEKAYLKKWQQ